MFSVGDPIGAYQIVARLKSGGMAELFLGHKKGVAGFSRMVAIKTIHEHLMHDEQFIKMFLDEAMISSRIHHPNVVHVEELFEAKGRYHLVLEYIHGVSLAEFLITLASHNKKLHPALACKWVVQIAEGLHAAHGLANAQGELLNLVHRDISPQNMLVGQDGHIKLIDFGVIKAKGRIQETSAKSLKGKIRYMSPEQATGLDVDCRSDVYSLAIVLWEMLTGRRMFAGSTDVELLERVRHPQFVPPSALDGALPPKLDDVIQTALQKDPELRFQSASAFRRALLEAYPEALRVEALEASQLIQLVMREPLMGLIHAIKQSASGAAEAELGLSEPKLYTPSEAEHIVSQLTLPSQGQEYLSASAFKNQDSPTSAKSTKTKSQSSTSPKTTPRVGELPTKPLEAVSDLIPTAPLQPQMLQSAMLNPQIPNPLPAISIDGLKPMLGASASGHSEEVQSPLSLQPTAPQHPDVQSYGSPLSTTPINPYGAVKKEMASTQISSSKLPKSLLSRLGGGFALKSMSVQQRRTLLMSLLLLAMVVVVFFLPPKKQAGIELPKYEPQRLNPKESNEIQQADNHGPAILIQRPVEKQMPLAEQQPEAPRPQVDAGLPIQQQPNRPTKSTRRHSTGPLKTKGPSKIVGWD